MKALLLGGGGFVGKSLIPLVSQHLELTVATSQAKLEVPKGVSKVLYDVGNYQDLEIKVDVSQFGEVIDCSWQGLPDLGAGMNQRNLQSKRSLIQFLRSKDVGVYNGFGSCLEYGSKTGAVDENTTGIDVGEFGKTKLQILELLQKSGLAFRWFRPFYLVGADQHHNSLFNSVYKALSEGVEFIPRSRPSTSFDFLDISDFARGVSLAMQSNAGWGVTNLGSGNAHSIAEVVNEFRLHFGLKPEEVVGSDAMFASTNKLETLTGWSPNFELSQMVSRFIQQKERAW